ncbi:MAG: Anhydrotetracycline monooxygenase [Luteibacter sp.]|uniref:FAD-dependent monooxygenase n=1 Tax=Luteibacter sp. TaxID=1886636 RepID=UPI00137F0D0A|nr:FAD-dependent monooxygenase [Luteibacter sp.]KAF1004070.1 MAG: Anhydrotetracycline monooxygenase [Luteibacter sp.]
MIHDVIIAGAGPVGLFLACELRLGGLSVLLLEREATPASPWKNAPFGTRGLTVPTVSAFRNRGLLDELVAAQAPIEDGRSRQLGGHFAGIPIDDDKVDTSAWTWRLPDDPSQGMATDMAAVEAVLTRRAMALGVEIRRGMAVQAMTSSPDDVLVEAGGCIFRSRWLVGCDGGRSVVRKLAGFDVVGTEPGFTGYSAQVQLANPEVLRSGRIHTDTGMYVQSRPGTIAMVEFDGGAFHRGDALTIDHVQAVLRRVSGTNVTLEALDAATTWTDRARQVTNYRRGRVLLAGDAAHIHSPLGGQGLNLGLGDAMNLGWKLAATVRGDAPDGLLDTYTTERHPVGADVLDLSRAQVALMRPDPGSRALGGILRDLIGTRDGATYFAERMRGLSVRYDLGQPHPLVGRSVPDLPLADGQSIHDLLANGKGVFVDGANDPVLRRMSARFESRLTYTTGETASQRELSTLLIRPDGIVAWVGDDRLAPDSVGQVLCRWFGAGEAT